MEIKSRIEGQVAVVEISGRLSAENVDVLRNEFMELFNNHRCFVFDLDKMEYLDSTGLGAIVFCLKTCKEFGGTLKIANLKDKPRIIFEITKAHRIFDIYDNLDMAIAACEKNDTTAV